MLSAWESPPVRVGKGRLTRHRERFGKLMFRVLALRQSSDETRLLKPNFLVYSHRRTSVCLETIDLLIPSISLVYPYKDQ